MTNYPSDNGGYLVEVQAQVMTRDHSTECWVPMGGGGLSAVKLCKLAPTYHPSSSPSTTPPPKAEYVIHGERLADKSVVLDCILTKDLQYTKANPKFHHWNSDDKRFGLTFERCDDARAFDHGIRHAVAELNEGTEAEERIFQAVDLPVGGRRKNSSPQSTSTTSTTTTTPSPTSPPPPLHTHSPPIHLPHSFPFTHPHLHRVHYMPAQTHKPPPRQTGGGGGGGDSEKEEEDWGGVGVGGCVYSGVHRARSPPSQDSVDSWGVAGEDVWVRYEDYAPRKSHLLLSGGGGESGGSYYKDEPYVIFAKNKTGGLHEYSYPSLEPGLLHSHHHHPHPPATTKRDGSTANTTTTTPPPPRKYQPLITQPPPLHHHHHLHHLHHPHPPPPPPPLLPTKTKNSCKGGSGKGDQSRRLVVPASSARQCRHCRVVFSADENHRGSCDSAPDAATDCIECVTCVSCTKPLFYHCCADADGQYSHPCQCSGGRGGGVGGGGGVRGGGGGGGGEEERNCRKWIGLTLLSCLLPCLWCYLPLHACHRCGVACGVCGGRHKAA